MKRSSSIWLSIDWVLVGLTVLLMLCGWVSIYSASYDPAHTNIFSFGEEYGKQFMWICLALGFGFIIMNIESRVFLQLSYAAYGVVLLMLILVLLVGKEVGGAKAWFGFGGFGVQPSEFAKIAISLTLAAYLSSIKERFKSLRVRLISIAIVAVPAMLIMLQPDLGTVLVFTAFIIAMYREGLSGNILIVGFVGAFLGVLAIISSYAMIDYPFAGEASGIFLFAFVILVLGLLSIFLLGKAVLPRKRKVVTRNAIIITVGALFFVGSINFVVDNVLKSHQKKRIEILLGLDEDPQGAGYNVKQSKTAIGSGGWFGKGHRQGPFTMFNFVPEQSTDFIFCTVGEEWGFVGSTMLILLYTIVIIRMIFISERQRSQFTRIYGYCVSCIFLMHLLINVGMVIGLAPVIGIPLPFFSYGGSSLLAFSALIFILIRLDADRLNVLR